MQFSAIWFVFEVLKLVVGTNIISVSKMHRIAKKYVKLEVATRLKLVHEIETAWLKVLLNT